MYASAGLSFCSLFDLRLFSVISFPFFRFYDSKSTAITVTTGIARIYDLLHDPENAITYYKKVLVLDATNIESIACLGAHCFYSDQPELSIRYYRRLLQMGVNNTEVWNNIGLCCFYASQYDMALGCFDRALSLAGDEDMADVWYV